MGFFEKFGQAWQGGYFEGEPLDPMAPSGYGVFGYNSILYTVYLTCIRNYVNPETTALEIGPGRGAWTKAILKQGCKLVYAVDAAAAEHTRFWEHVGATDRARYIQCADLSLSGVPDNSVDYFFSFGVFCHLKPEMCEDYLASLARKMRPGSHGFLMIADYDKYDYCVGHADQFSIQRPLGSRGVLLPAKVGYWLSWTLFRSKFVPRTFRKRRLGTRVAIRTPPAGITGDWTGLAMPCAARASRSLSGTPRSSPATLSSTLSGSNGAIRACPVSVRARKEVGS
jgi:phospholipid N-methyltransferase